MLKAEELRALVLQRLPFVNIVGEPKTNEEHNFTIMIIEFNGIHFSIESDDRLTVSSVNVPAAMVMERLLSISPTIFWFGYQDFWDRPDYWIIRADTEEEAWAILKATEKEIEDWDEVVLWHITKVDDCNGLIIKIDQARTSSTFNPALKAT